MYLANDFMAGNKIKGIFLEGALADRPDYCFKTWHLHGNWEVKAITTNHTRVDKFNYCRSLTSVWTFVKDCFSHLRANQAIFAFRCWLSKWERKEGWHVCRPNPKQVNTSRSIIIKCFFNRFLIKCLKLDLCFCRFNEGEFMTLKTKLKE